MLRRSAFLLLLFSLFFSSACAAFRAKATLAAATYGAPADFDPSLPRLILPSRIRDSAAPPRHPMQTLLTTATEIKAGRESTRFEALRVRGVVEGSFALTELHIALRNLEERTVETRFAVNLPRGGVVTRFAMKRAKGEWQEGHLGGATTAREAYERLLQRGIDPGLVEIDGADRVRVRLFPVTANETWDVLLTVLSPCGNEPDAYRLPLAGTNVDLVDAQILVEKKVALYMLHGAPADDLALAHHEEPATPGAIADLGAAYTRLRALEERRRGDPALSAEIRKQSLTSGILVRETAYVVLETANDFDDVGIKASDKTVVGVGRSGATTGKTRPPPRVDSNVTVDRDADGIPDQVDRCPDDELDEDTDDGCPDLAGAARVMTGRPGLLRERVRFATKDAALSTTARALLEEIATALRQSPRIGLVEVAGHTRAGAAGETMALADTRANAVRSFLIAKGVAADRLVARPYGDRLPTKPHDGEHASENERVELVALVVDGKRRTDPALQHALPPAHLGYFGRIEALIADKAREEALTLAQRWVRESGEVLAYVALGNAYEARRDEKRATEAYAMLFELLPERPVEWRAVLGFLDRLALKSERAASTALEGHRRVHRERPDAYASTRGFVYALARGGQHREAFETARSALLRSNRQDVAALLRTDIALLGAAWMRAEPSKRDAIMDALVAANVPLPRGRSTQVVLGWENDATNVDFEIIDARGGKIDRSAHVLRSGGELRLDTRNGYGPDWFSLDGPASAGPYRLAVVYSARGAMGPVIGRITIVKHDGAGILSFDERPFVLFNERARLDLGSASLE